jgi:hypothetical protein
MERELKGQLRGCTVQASVQGAVPSQNNTSPEWKVKLSRDIADCSREVLMFPPSLEQQTRGAVRREGRVCSSIQNMSEGGEEGVIWRQGEGICEWWAV